MLILSEVIPQITFSADFASREGLGEINFNFKAFTELAKKYGASDDDISKLTVEFTPNNIRRLRSLGTYGLYTKNKIRVFCADTPEMSTKRHAERPRPLDLDSVFRHEMGHWIGHLESDIYSRQMRRTRRELGGAAVLGASIPPTAYIQNDNRLMPLYVFGMAVPVAYTLWKYGRSSLPLNSALNHPTEGGANQFELETRDSPIVTAIYNS